MEYQQLKQQATNYLHQENYTQAAAIYEQCSETNPEDMSNYWYLGLAYLLQEDEVSAQTIWTSVLLQGTSEEAKIWTEDLINLLKTEAAYYWQNNNLVVAEIIETQIQAIESEQNEEKLVDNPPKNLKKLEEEALSFALLGKFEEAEKKYQELLYWDRNNADAWSNLGMIYYETLKNAEALNLVIHAININPEKSNYYYNLGLILEKLEQIPQSLAAYQQAINLDSHHLDAYNNLGNLLSKLGQTEEAELIYRQAIEANPKQFGSYINLGNILLGKQQFSEAIETYEKALQLKNRDPDILYNLGLAYQGQGDEAQANLHFGYTAYRQGNYEEAISYFQKFLSTQTGDIYFYIALADCYKTLNQQEESIKTYQEAIQKYPNEAEIYCCLIENYQKFGRLSEAISLGNKALELFPNNLSIKRINLWLLPVIYNSLEEIEFYRNRFTHSLEELTQQTSLESEEEKNNALKSIKLLTNFYLHYQGKNDLELQKKYGNFVSKVMEANYPQYNQSPTMLPFNSERKIRVGYISERIGDRFFNQLNLGRLQHSNRDKFQLYCYDIGHRKNTSLFELYSDHFYKIKGNNIEDIYEQIIADTLDILIFLEIGMDPQMTQVASLRLAPIQCTTWGHPITSGLPTIDYFLGSDAMESPQAQEHYSEQLIRLPNLGTFYPEPELPKTTKKRSDFKIKNEAIVYLCCQYLAKYLPQHDYIFPRIVQGVPQAQFIFFEPYSEKVTEQFRQRLQRSFAQFDLDIDEFCLFLPRQGGEDYFSVHRISDVFLDTFLWSGGFTTLDAINCNLPVVTCPDELMRSRQSYGMLKIIGVTDTVANNEAEYIEIAVGLGLDSQWRYSIHRKLAENRSRLYNDFSSIRELEAFFEQAVRGQMKAEVVRQKAEGD